MIYDLSTLLSDRTEGVRDEVLVRCRVRSGVMPGEAGGQKAVYLVEDVQRHSSEFAALSFWEEQPSHEGLRKTESYVLSALDIPISGGDTSDESSTADSDFDQLEGVGLQRGEELIVRAIPNYRPGQGQASLYLNVTSVVIRSPQELVSKSKLRVQEHCPREYYLRYVKRVYAGDRHGQEPYHRAAVFRGNAVHQLTEEAIEDHLDRFVNDEWTPELIESYCEEFLDDGFGFKQALLVMSGAGLAVREHIVEIVTNLFTDKEFLNRLGNAESIEVEQFLNDSLGYAGRVDILLDQVPYDIKTTRNPTTERIEGHKYQLKLYLFALLLENLPDGESLTEAVKEGRQGYLVYPNTDGECVQFETVKLEVPDIVEFLQVRNDATKSGNAFAPPSTYDRECEGCAFAVEEWVSGPDDTLPSACTFHCQNERRWPCYELEDGKVESDCSLFEDCEQRLQYRDPSEIDHYEGVRSALRDERSARANASRVLNRFDKSILADAGYLLTGLSLSGMESSGTVLRFDTSEVAVPAFGPGDTVSIRSPDDAIERDAVYFGTRDGEYRFKLEDGSYREFLTQNTTFEALYTFSTRKIEERYLPYLDFAQRRGITPGVRRNGGVNRENTPAFVEVADISTYLDREEVLIDIPTSTTRASSIEDLVNELVTTDIPQSNSLDKIVPNTARRVLVVGTTPDLVDLAATAQPSGPHYRIDETAGQENDQTIRDSDGYHDIQTNLLESTSIVSSVHQATSTSGPGGVRELFHELQEGEFGDRDHSENFFDLLVILGAEQLTEPEYHFLADVADKSVLVGDIRARGPEMVSTSAVEADLEVSYFEQAFDHYQAFSIDTAVSLQLKGEAPPALQQYYSEGPWEAVDGTLRFLDIEGDEATAIETIELESSVRADNGPGRRLVFDVTDTPINPIEAQELFEERQTLDATKLIEESVVVIDDESLYLEEIDTLPGKRASHHEIHVRASAAELPRFSRALLRNEIAEKIVTKVAKYEDIDLIVTPFESHANAIKRRLAEEDCDANICRPEDLDGTIAEEAIVSFATANEGRIVRPPLDETAVLYRLLSCAREITMIGNGDTLKTKDLFESLIEIATPYNN